jgi:hypothetical protein
MAKAREIRDIAGALNVRPEELLIDIAEPGFDIRRWAANLQDWEAVDPEEDRFAVMLAASVRARREDDRALTIALLERDFGIAPVILSRLENAQKVLDRWNRQTTDALCRLFSVTDIAGLRKHVLALHQKGALDPYLNLIANPALRMEKSLSRLAALRRDLDEGTGAGPKPKTPQPRRTILVTLPETESAQAAVASTSDTEILADGMATVRLVPVFGTPLADGLIAHIATGETVEAPRRAGPQSYGLRVCRPTLGPGLPARAVVVVDPDCLPSAGGIVVAREDNGLRLLMVTFDRSGRMIGYSQNPDKEIALDDLDPASLGAVIGAIYE